MSEELENKLLEAVKFGNVNVVKKLLDDGVNIEAKGNVGHTPLEYAAEYGKINIVNLLLKRKEQISKCYLNNALCIAARGGYIDAVKELLKNDADVNFNNGFGTALKYAAEYGHINVVEELINAKAELNCKTSVGETPLMNAATNGHLKIVEMLVDAGADVNAESKYGWTALKLSIDYPEIMMLLILSGADTRHIGNWNWPMVGMYETKEDKFIALRLFNIWNKYKNRLMVNHEKRIIA